jgi:hypothetical protein
VGSEDSNRDLDLKDVDEEQAQFVINLAQHFSKVCIIVIGIQCCRCACALPRFSFGGFLFKICGSASVVD